jgi:predicted dehydrogenase
MTDPVGVGLVGVGMWGRRMAAAANRTPGLRLASCFVRDPTARAEAAGEIGCRPAPSLEALLDDPEVEAVLVATPNHAHREIVVAAAERDRHVLVEKPVADTVEAAEAMRDACDAAGVVLLVAHCFRRLGAARATADLIQSGALGTVVLAEASFSLPGAFAAGTWRSRRETLPGGPMTQLGVHHADTLQAWLGPAVTVRGSMAHLAADAEVDDVAVAVLDHASGARSAISCSYVSPKTYRLRVYGTDANLDYRTDMSIWPSAERMDAATTLTLERAGGDEPVPFDQRDMLVDELEEFVRCVRGRGRPETGAAEGIAALGVILGAVSSAEGGYPVPLVEEVRLGPGQEGG